MDETGAFVCFQVHSMNIAEQTVAQSLLKEAPPRLNRILGDTIHDSIPLHRVAHATGRRLYTPLRQGRVGRRRQPQRLRLLRLLQHGAMRKLLRWRIKIEQAFALMSNLSFGFKGLPAWVRGPHRVGTWMWGKILLYHANLLRRPALA